MLPRENIPCSTSVTLQQFGISASCTVAVCYEDNNEGDILNMLGLDQVPTFL